MKGDPAPKVVATALVCRKSEKEDGEEKENRMDASSSALRF